jgi:thiamine monophosphate synthase
MDDAEKFYRYLESALNKKYPLVKVIEKDEEIKKLYDKYKNEEKFKDLMKKYSINYPE